MHIHHNPHPLGLPPDYVKFGDLDDFKMSTVEL